MIATYINSIAVVVGALIGLFVGSKLKDEFKELIFISSGIVTLIIGISMALQTQSFLVLLFSIIIGGIIGHLVGIEEAILRLGNWMEKKSSSSKDEQEGKMDHFSPEGF